MVKLSVIVHVFNTEKYLGRCLESVINQTFKDIEIICINDGASDSSQDILNDYATKDERFIIINPENSEAVSRSLGIDMANGEYLFFLDADGWLELDAFEKLYENAKSNDSDIVLFNSIEQNISSKIYKTSFLKENNIQFDNDMDFQIKSMILAKRISHVPEILYNHDKSSPQLIKSDCNTSLINFNNVEEFLKQNNLWDEFRLNFYEFKIKELKTNLSAVSDEYKEEYYNEMRKEFIKMDVSFNELKTFPTSVYKFYMLILNVENYISYKRFHKLKGSPFKYYVNKKLVQEEIDKFNEIGITENKRNPKIIVSLTSFPKRMTDIHFCLYSLLKQNFKPDEVILWLSEEEFPNKENDLPESVLSLRKNGLSIKWCENIRSYKKLIPCLREYPDDFIVTADDDIFYPENWLECLWQYHLKYPDCVISQRSRKIEVDSNNSFKPYETWKLIKNDVKESYLNLCTCGSGTLFFPDSLSENVVKQEIFQKISPTSDDLWFWAMAVLNKVKIKAIPNSNMLYLCYVNYARDFGFLEEKTLYHFNSVGGNTSNFNNILSCFPEILDIINQERE